MAALRPDPDSFPQGGQGVSRKSASGCSLVHHGAHPVQTMVPHHEDCYPCGYSGIVSIETGLFGLLRRFPSPKLEATQPRQAKLDLSTERVYVPIFIGPQSSVPQRSSAPGLGFRTPLLNGEQGTAQTIALMRQLVDAAVSDATFVRKAIDIVRGVAAFDEIGEIEALYSWVKRSIRYTKDPVTKEKLYPPQELLKIRAGDCDDISMLLAAFLIAIGYPARWITLSANSQSPDEFSHIYVEAEAPAGSGNWIPMDAARLDSQFGIEPPVYYRKRAWSITEDSYTDLNGAKRRLPKFLSGYVSTGLGQDDGFNWQPILQQSIAEVPTIISAVAGKPSTQTGPYGSYSTSSPYGSFATPYTPGYGIPPAGYSSPIFGSSMGNMLPLLLIGGLVLLMAGRRS
jgi:hypothetical protein